MKWREMSDNLYISRSNKERIQYENDDKIFYDIYTQHVVDDQEIYDTENYEYEQHDLLLVMTMDEYDVK